MKHAFLVGLLLTTPVYAPAARQNADRSVTATTSGPCRQPIVAQPLDDLKIVEHAWSLSFNGAHWTVRVKNESRCLCYEGLRFKTRYLKPSGALEHESVIAQARIVAIQPGETKEVQFNDGMRIYAEQASISIESALLCR